METGIYAIFVVSEQNS